MTFEEFKKAVIDAAKENNLTDYEIYYTESSGLSVSVFKQEIKEYTNESSLGVCFKCIIDEKTGYAATENISENDAKDMVSRAIANAKSIENDEICFIHKKGDTYASQPEVNKCNPSGKELTQAAFAIQNAAYAADKRVIDGTRSSSGHAYVKYALINSNGLDLSNEAAFDYGVSLVILEEGDEKYNAYKVEGYEDIMKADLDDLAKKAVKNGAETIGAEEIPSGKYKAILNNEVMYTLLETYSSVFYAEAAQKGLSLLNGKEGEVIASELITITDDPMSNDAPIKRTFDDEGVATVKKNVVENGKLCTLLYNLKSANTANVKSTGNGSKASYTSPVGTSPFSFSINPGETSEEDLCKLVGEGVMITSISGLHAGANPITGDFSLLSEGFKIENGKKAAPIKNFTISGNFFSLLKDVKVLGSDFEYSASMECSRFGSPSVMLDEISIAGK